VGSSTLRRVSGALAAVALAALAAGVLRASVGPSEQRGIFALLGGTPKILSEFWAVQGTGLSATLQIRQLALDGKTPILNYDADMEKLIHLVVVRDDFATFAHLHPTFEATTGIFAQRFTKEPNHRYYVYADTVPRHLGQQVFRFTMESDGPAAAYKLATTPSSTSSLIAPYTVTLGRTTLAANQAQTLSITIFEGARPARNLGTYLGALAHAIFINISTLEYAHVHAMARGSTMSMGMPAQPSPFMQMTLPPFPAGTYKLWIQFRGARGLVYTAPFTILVR
jgi:hypothetical protein